MGAPGLQALSPVVMHVIHRPAGVCVKASATTARGGTGVAANADRDIRHVEKCQGHVEGVHGADNKIVASGVHLGPCESICVHLGAFGLPVGTCHTLTLEKADLGIHSYSMYCINCYLPPGLATSAAPLCPSQCSPPCLKNLSLDLGSKRSNMATISTKQLNGTVDGHAAKAKPL